MALLLFTPASALAAPRQQPATFKTIQGTPLKIEVGTNASVQVYHDTYPDRGAAYGTADSGFFLAIDGAIYGPDLENTNSNSAYNATTGRFDLVSQAGPTGSGTTSDPFEVVTNQTLNSSDANLAIIQTVSYVNGDPFFRQDRAITNNGGSEVCFKAYHAADVYFAGSDSGAGYYDPNTGSVGGANAAEDWFMVFSPITPATHYQEGEYSGVIWNAVQNGLDLGDSIDPNVIDNGFALQWDRCVQPNETVTISDYWSFGENVTDVVPPPAPTTVPTTTVPATTTTSTAPPTTVPVPPPVVPICSWGDVHMRTPDGLVYDFQEVGDFVLLQSDSGDAVVQARQEAWVSNPQVSINTAAAMFVAGDKLEFYLKPERRFYINDVLTDLPSSDIQLPQGGSISVTSTPAKQNFTVLWPDGNTAARVTLNGDSHVDIGVARAGGSLTYEGICGNLDGNPQNDIQIRNGDQIAPPASLDQLQSFGDSWRASADESLFLDEPPASEGARVAPLTLFDLEPAVRSEARQTCQDAGVSDQLALDTCTYDVGATGDDIFVESAMTFEASVAELPAAANVVAVPSQSLEVGEQYAVPDTEGTFRYFQLTQLPTEPGGPATLKLCPDLQGDGQVFLDDIMTDEAAQARGLTASNQPCTGSAATPDPEPTDSVAPAQDPAPAEPEDDDSEFLGGALPAVLGGLGALLAIIIFLLVRRGRQPQEQRPEASPDGPQPPPSS